jgi:hypothetical protein
LHPESDDKVPAFPDGAPALTVFLLGWTGGEQCPAFARSPEARDGFPDPLNRWSKRAIDSIAGPLDATALYPFCGPPWHDFQRWVLKAEAVYRSPLGLLIHPNWDSGIRIAGRLPCASGSLRPRESAANPCEVCRDRPCLSAWPVSAFAPERTYDHAACRQYLEAGEADCLTRACLS